MAEFADGDIADAAQTPKRVAGDEGQVEERPIGDKISADRYERAKTATAAPFGIYMAKIRFPNAE